MHVLIADSAGGAWNFGGSVLTFAFPMILFVVVAGALYVLYTKPELMPGRWVQGERPVSYTAVPRLPEPAEPGQAGAVLTAPGWTAPAETLTAPPDAGPPVADSSEEAGSTDASEASTGDGA